MHGEMDEGPAAGQLPDEAGLVLGDGDAGDAIAMRALRNRETLPNDDEVRGTQAIPAGERRGDGRPRVLGAKARVVVDVAGSC